MCWKLSRKCFKSYRNFWKTIVAYTAYNWLLIFTKPQFNWYFRPVASQRCNIVIFEMLLYYAAIFGPNQSIKDRPFDFCKTTNDESCSFSCVIDTAIAPLRTSKRQNFRMQLKIHHQTRDPDRSESLPVRSSFIFRSSERLLHRSHFNMHNI